MLALPSLTARGGSPRRWATAAVIAAILLADVPRAPDRTTDRATATGGAADPCAVCDRPSAGAPPRDPLPRAPSAPAAGGPAGAPHRASLHHVIGL